MAYETGAAATVDALLQKISTFALGLGYTINRDIAITDGRELCIYHVDAGYFNFHSYNVIQDFQSGIENPSPRINMYGSTAYDAGNAISAMTGTSLKAVTNGLPPDFHKYHLFGTTSYIHCVVEIQPGLFAHLGCGKAEKSWAFDGGEYIYGTVWSHGTYIDDPMHTYHSYPMQAYTDDRTAGCSRMRVDLEGVSPRWFDFKRTSTDKIYSSGNVYSGVSTFNPYAIYGGSWSYYSPSSINGLTVLMPCIMVCVTNSSKIYSVGKVNDFRFCMIDLVTPSQTITYGADDWMVFPIKKKQLGVVTNPEFSSGTLGMAYRKV